MENIEKIRNIVCGFFENSSQKKYWEHTLRVTNYAEYICKSENGDLNIIIPAALLHDIGMTVDPTFKGHVEKSIFLADKILKDLNYSNKEVAQITKTIGSHHPIPGSILETLEEQILFDADSIEIIGVFGVIRWIGSFPATTKELLSSIALFESIVGECKAKRDSLFYTKTGRLIGDNVVDSTLEYFSKVKNQILKHDSILINPNPIAF